MNINIIKNKLSELTGKKLKIKVYLGRNKHEFFDGKIKDIHPNIFTIETNKGIKSFTYADLLTKVVILNKFK